MYMLYKKFVRE